MQPIARHTTIFLALVALAQFLRLVLQVEVVAGGMRIPLWASAVAYVMSDNEQPEVSIMTADGRDELGRFAKGHHRVGKSGKPPKHETQRLQLAILRAADDATLNAWVKAFQRKLAVANPWATEFLFDRLIGKVEDQNAARASGPIQVNVVFGGGSGGGNRFDVVDAAPAALSDRTTTDATQETEGVYRVASEAESCPGR